MSLLVDRGLALNAFRLILAFPCVGIDGLAPRLFGGCRPFKLRPHPPQDQGHFPKRPIKKILKLREIADPFFYDHVIHHWLSYWRRARSILTEKQGVSDDSSG